MPWPKGKPQSKEHRDTIAATMKERGVRPVVHPGPEAMIEWNRHHANDPEERRRRSERAKASGAGRWMAGRPANEGLRARCRSRRGKTYDDIYGDRANEEAAKRRDANRRRWDGHRRKPDVRPKHNASHEYTAWRRAVFTRDDFTCPDCGRRGGKLNAHHVKPWATYPEHRYDIDNGVTLCKPCHDRRHERREAFALAGIPDPTSYVATPEYAAP